MLAMHGALFLNLKMTDSLQKRAITAARISAIAVIVIFTLGGIWIYYGIDGYQLNSILPHDGPSNPLQKLVIQEVGAWFFNYHLLPASLLLPVMGIGGALVALFTTRWVCVAFFSSALCVAGIIGTVGVSMFPFILPSSSHPEQSLLVWDSSSSQLTLFIMLIATVLFLPLILAYTAWVYRVLRGKVTSKTVKDNQDFAY